MTTLSAHARPSGHTHLGVRHGLPRLAPVSCSRIVCAVKPLLTTILYNPISMSTFTGRVAQSGICIECKETSRTSRDEDKQ